MTAIYFSRARVRFFQRDKIKLSLRVHFINDKGYNYSATVCTSESYSDRVMIHARTRARSCAIRFNYARPASRSCEEAACVLEKRLCAGEYSREYGVMCGWYIMGMGCDVDNW